MLPPERLRFYFVIYIAILLIIVSSYLLFFDYPVFMIRFRDNLITKLLFWPLLMSSMLVVTIITFFWH